MDQLAPVRNATKASKQFAASSVGQLARIEALVTASCLLVIVLVLSSSRRRHERNALARLLVWGAFMFNYPVISYTVGLMQSSSHRNELFVVWACFLLLLLGSADAMTAFSFSDSQQQTRSMMNQALHIVYLLFLILYYKDQLRASSRASLFLLWGLSIARLGLRVKAYRSASRAHGLVTENQVVFEYMKYEPLNSAGIQGGEYDPVNMKEYIYLVDGKEEEKVNYGEEVISVSHKAEDTVTVNKVWQCKGWLLSSGGRGAGRRRDLCLSFALFRLLRLRFAPDHVGEINFPFQGDKCRDFVIKGLLSDDRDLDRAFRVVEAELGFLFDFFYARYPSIKDTLAFNFILFTLILAASLFTLVCSVPLRYRPAGASTNIIIHGFDLDVLLTRLVIVLYIFLESYQFLALIFSDWHKVKMLCRYVLRESWHRAVVDALLKVLCHFSVTKYWKNSINQYFLLDDLASRPVKAFISSVTLKTFDPWMMTSSIGLPREVKQAVLRALKASKGKITDGRMWLYRIGVVDLDLDRDCLLGHTYARYILNWHIATSICDLELSKSDVKNGNAEFKNHYEVATKLSGYCAYLVAFAPDLVPDSTYTSQSLSRGTLQNARGYLAECKSNKEKYDKLINLGRSDSTDHSVRFVSEGARIAVYLADRMADVEVRWKVLAEFWANLLLYIAASDRATPHAAQLASGGELITIIWALLTHADVINKLQHIGGAPGLHMLLRDASEANLSSPERQDGDGNGEEEDNEDGPWVEEIESLPEDNVEIKIT